MTCHPVAVADLEADAAALAAPAKTAVPPTASITAPTVAAALRLIKLSSPLETSRICPGTGDLAELFAHRVAGRRDNCVIRAYALRGPVPGWHRGGRRGGRVVMWCVVLRLGGGGRLADLGEWPGVIGLPCDALTAAGTGSVRRVRPRADGESFGCRSPRTPRRAVRGHRT